MPSQLKDWIGFEGGGPEVECGYQVAVRDKRVAKRLHDRIVQGAAERAVRVCQDGRFAGTFGSSRGAGPGNGDARFEQRRIVQGGDEQVERGSGGDRRQRRALGVCVFGVARLLHPSRLKTGWSDTNSLLVCRRHGG